MEELNSKLEASLKLAKKASRVLSHATTDQKNEALVAISNKLLENSRKIIKANELDVQVARAKGLSEAMINRLIIDEDKLKSIAKDVISVSELGDPVGETIEEVFRPSGLIIKKVRVPFGVVAAIYESRPNVSVDVACLCIKTGNACVLKGGSEAINTNIVLALTMREAIKDIIPMDSITFIDSIDRTIVSQLIKCKEYLDLVIPRGGAGLIKFVVENATVPYIETGTGNCHMYIDKDAQLSMAWSLALSAKISRPSTCNSLEKLLVDRTMAKAFLPKMKELFDENHVLVKGCEETRTIIDCEEAKEEDYYKEYNDYIITIKIVDGVSEAIDHILKYSTQHSETIVTENQVTAEKFLEEVDSACIYQNASTRFTDGGEFGMGAELGISTQKLHARGPMGLVEMTSYKYKIYGDGQTR